MSSGTKHFRDPVKLRWADIDANFHLRHSVYYDLGSAQRINFLAAHGATMELMKREHFGPVLFREECRFFREIRLEDPLEIEVAMASMSRDHRKFGFQHRLLCGDVVCAVIRVEGAWFNVLTRKLCVPPQVVVDAVADAPRTEDFVWT